MIKIFIIGKRNQMGTTPVINLKGLSRLIYKFEWDSDLEAYAYEPKNQREADDIFNTQNKLYTTIRFSVWLGDSEKKKEDCPKDCPKCEELEKPAKKKRGRPKKKVAA